MACWAPRRHRQYSGSRWRATQQLESARTGGFQKIREEARAEGEAPLPMLASVQPLRPSSALAIRSKGYRGRARQQQCPSVPVLHSVTTFCRQDYEVLTMMEHQLW